MTADLAYLPAKIDLGILPAPARRLLDAKTPAPLRQMAAKGISPGLKPHESLAVIVLLANPAIILADAAAAGAVGPADLEAASATARATLEKLPAALLQGALNPSLLPWVIDALVPLFARDAAVMERILALPQISFETVAHAATLASEAVAELIATNEQKMLEHPPIIEAIYMNKATRMSTADRVLELAVRNKLELTGIPAYREAAAAIINELIAEPQPEPTFDDILYVETEQIAQIVTAKLDAAVEDTHEVDEETGEEKIKEVVLPLHAQLAKMTVSQKIRRAMLGSAGDRMLLVRDNNKLVAAAAIKSPSIQENEVVRISSSRNVSDDVLRIIANSGEWTHSHQIKLNLVMNPRTPLVFSSRLIQHLREHELKALAKSKNVTGAIQTAAKQILERRVKKK
ncbi:MAG: hypothetical protein JWM74_6172 [Myxococcaceae bacterium]|nr:hypothetical protein [Myxococcaceae bacterium]